MSTKNVELPLDDGGTLTREQMLVVVNEMARQYNLVYKEVNFDIKDGDAIESVFLCKDAQKWLAINPHISVELAHHQGGDDEGSYYHDVYKITVNGEYGYLLWRGDYDSYSGTNWAYYNNPQKVSPTYKTVIVTEWK